MSDKVAIACPKCAKRLKVPTSAKGKKIKCPACQMVFRIGAPSKKTVPVVQPQAVRAPQVPSPPVSNVANSNQLDSLPSSPPTDPLAPQESFQSKLVKRGIGQPKKKSTRKDKLRKAKAKKAAAEAEEADWQTASFGFALIVIGFVSVGMPEADGMAGGRGAARLISRFLFQLGPFAPLIGMFLGLGGVAMVVVSLQRVHKAITLSVGGLLSLLLLGFCGTSFVNAIGFFDSMATQGKVSQFQAGDAAAAMEFQKIFHKNAMAEMAEFQRNVTSDGFSQSGSGSTSSNGSFASENKKKPAKSSNQESRSAFASSSSNSGVKDDPFGTDSNQGGSSNPFGTDSDSESSSSPFGTDSNKGSSSNPFDEAEKLDGSPTFDPQKDDPFGSSSSDRDPFARGSTKKKEPPSNEPQDENAFGSINGAMEGSMSAAEKRKNDFAKQADLAQRSIQEGKTLGHFNSVGFKSNVNLALGETAGQTSGRIGFVYYRDLPITGVEFFQAGFTFVLPSKIGEKGDGITSAKQGEALFGFNLNFEASTLAGIQGIYGASNGREIAKSSLTVGEWIGSSPTGDNFETAMGNGKPIHGFAVHKKGVDVVGLQLVVKK